MNPVTILNSSPEEIIKAITELKTLSNVIENSREWHKHDSVLNHTFSVFEKLKSNMAFPFIDDDQQKKKYTSYFTQTVGNLTRWECLLWAALFHDIAKPDTIKTVDGFTQCPGHEKLGARKVAGILPKYLTNNHDVDQITSLVEAHDYISGTLRDRQSEDVLIREIENLNQKYKNIFPELVLLTLSDMEGSQLNETNPQEFSFRQTFLRRIITQ